MAKKNCWLQLMQKFTKFSTNLYHQQQKQQQGHHLRQRRHEFSTSQAIYEKNGNFVDLSGQITFGHDTIVGPEGIFLTKNASTVRAHIGSTALLPCDVIQGSQFGMVRINHHTSFFLVLFSIA